MCVEGAAAALVLVRERGAQGETCDAGVRERGWRGWLDAVGIRASAPHVASGRLYEGLAARKSMDAEGRRGDFTSRGANETSLRAC